MITVTADTTLPLHFFNRIGERKPYDWRPWAPRVDTVAVWFRVYANTLEGVNDGYDPSASSQVIGLRGDNLNDAGPLDWETTNVTLQRELTEENLAGFHLFSGVAYYPLLLVGQWQEYKFFIEPNGWEEGNLQGNRLFSISGQDTTLHWVYYGNTEPMGDDTVCVRGDINCDGSINVVDVLAVVNHILSIAPIPEMYLWRADCNGDMTINVLDAISIVNVILGIGQCVPGACKTEVTDETMEFLKALEPHPTDEEFIMLMTLVNEETQLPTEYHLAQNYPNPFNPTTGIRYQIADIRYPTHTILKIFNILGQEVLTLVDEVQEPGYYTVTWDGKDSHGKQVASGVYLYQLSVDGGQWSAIKRMVLMK